MGATARWRLIVAYDGSSFHGFAAQPGQRTVAGTLAEALARLSQIDTVPVLVCAGRTDAGVHATHQVIHVDLPDPLPPTNRGAVEPSEVRHRLNRQLDGQIAVLEATKVPQSFDARHNARWRRYRYLIHEADVPDPLLASLAWHVPGPLDVRAMAQAIGSLIGTHDFRCFCRKAPGTTSAEPIIRVVTHAHVDEVAPSGAVDLVAGRLIRIEIQAGAFCHQMVRSIVGQLVDIGRGRSTQADLMDLLRSASRNDAAQPAPPGGLCLIGVGYDEEAGLPEGSQST